MLSWGLSSHCLVVILNCSVLLDIKTGTFVGHSLVVPRQQWHSYVPCYRTGAKETRQWRSPRDRCSLGWLMPLTKGWKTEALCQERGELWPDWCQVRWANVLASEHYHQVGRPGQQLQEHFSYVDLSASGFGLTACNKVIQPQHAAGLFPHTILDLRLSTFIFLPWSLCFSWETTKQQFDCKFDRRNWVLISWIMKRF